jgi:hypothetical protein
LPFPDALQEFKVETSALPAQYGYHSAATVNAVTKAGTNEFHGDLFDFLRNGDLNARDFFATKRDNLKRNQYGGTGGGPVRKNKLFFFGGFQRTSQRSAPSGLTAFIPTAAMLTGDFTAITSPACQSNGKAITLAASQGFVNNKISPSLFNLVPLHIVNTLIPTSDPCGRELYGQIANLDENLFVARIDYQQSEKNSIFGRFILGNLNSSSTYDGKNPLSILSFANHNRDYQLALGDTYLITTNLINSVRVSASRENVVKVPDPYKSLTDFGANITSDGTPTTTVTVTGGGSFSIPGSQVSQSHDGPNPSVTDDISWVKGDHQLGFGGNLYFQGMNYRSNRNAVGIAAFDGSVTGLGMADFLLGDALSFTQGTVYGFYQRQYYMSLYAQDSWKINRRLTLNYGVRWEPFTSVYSKYGQLHHFDPELFAQNVHSTLFSNGPAGVIFPGDPQYGCGKGFACDKWNKFFPRFGLAWDPIGDGKMTIRAAYGLYGDRTNMFSPNFNIQGPPFADNIALSRVSISDPWAAYPGGNPIPALSALTSVGHASSNAPFPIAGTYISFQTTDFKPMYVSQWNLSIQRQVGQSWLLTANYLGNSQIHLPSSEEYNPPIFLGLGPCTLNVVNGAGQVVPTSYSTCSTTANQTQRRLLYLQNPSQGRYFDGIGRNDSGGTGTYDALFLSVQKRLNHGVTLLSSYTWSHCISDLFDQQTTSTGVAPANNRRQYRSNCAGSDLRQLFVLNMVATTPRFANRAMRLLASDWQVAPILQIKSAQFFTIAAGTDRALTAAANQTANLSDPTHVYASNRNVRQWLNPAAFGPSALGTYGNLGQNNIKGPGIFQLNLALSRTFPIWEKKSIQLRAEAFNLPNHLNPANPAASATAANFGQITSDVSGNNGLNSGDYRIIQLAMKFVF